MSGDAPVFYGVMAFTMLITVIMLGVLAYVVWQLFRGE